MNVAIFNFSGACVIVCDPSEGSVLLSLRLTLLRPIIIADTE